MLQDIIDIAQSLLQYSFQFCLITGVQFLLFLLFAKYKTSQTFTQLWHSYTQLFMRALLFTVTLLCIIILLTRYVSINSIAVMLLAVSSMSIVFKYFDIVKEEQGLIFDLWILLSNGYIMYSLVTGDPVAIMHYLVLYAIVLYVFLYQRLKVVYKED